MADKCVMNQAKRHRADVRGLQAEANREHDDKERYKGDINLAKSVDNTYLVKSDDWNASIDETLERYGIKEASNSVVLVTSVYTASPEWFKTHTEDEARAYFEACLEYDRRTKGEVINAVIHWDETTPHMHVATVPVVEVQDEACTPIVVKDKDGNDMTDDKGEPIYERYDKGKSKGKVKYQRTKVVDDAGNPVTHMGLNAKQVFGNRVAMSRRQTEFYEECGKPFGMTRGEIRVEDTKDAKQRLSEAKYRAQAIKVEARAQAEDIIADAQKDAQTRSKAILDEAKENAGLITQYASKDYKTASEALTEVRQLRTQYEQAIANVQNDMGLEEFAKGVKYGDGTTVYDRYRQKIDKKRQEQAQREETERRNAERLAEMQRRAESWEIRHSQYTGRSTYDGYERE